MKKAIIGILLTGSFLAATQTALSANKEDPMDAPRHTLYFAGIPSQPTDKGRWIKVSIPGTPLSRVFCFNLSGQKPNIIDTNQNLMDLVNNLGGITNITYTASICNEAAGAKCSSPIEHKFKVIKQQEYQYFASPDKAVITFPNAANYPTCNHPVNPL